MMTTHFADRLLAAVHEKAAPVCVGLDPVLERLPQAVLAEAGIERTADGQLADKPPAEAAAAALLGFGRRIIEAVASTVPAIKINIAFFERYDAAGLQTYLELVRIARRTGLIVIGDVKRADIGHSAAQYADAHLTGRRAPDAARPDAITINPYFGIDGVRPFIDAARREGGGVFVLVQTSNDSARQVQGLTLSDGETFVERVGQMVHEWSSGEGLIGESNYSCVGAVVSPQSDLQAAGGLGQTPTQRLRTLMPHCLFLVPGFGAQGRTGSDVAACFKSDGTGAIVNASRSVIFAYQDPALRRTCGDDWLECVRLACRRFVDEVRAAISR